MTTVETFGVVAWIVCGDVKDAPDEAYLYNFVNTPTGVCHGDATWGPDQSRVFRFPCREFAALACSAYGGTVKRLVRRRSRKVA